jgi:hypothetical protein
LKYVINLLCYLTSFQFLLAEPDLFLLSKQAYERKDFKNAARLSLQYLQSQDTISIHDPILEIFFQTEGDLARLDFFLEKAYSSSGGNSPQIYNLMAIFLEKCYHAKESKIGFRWGDIFLQEGGNSKRYARGIFAYSGMLFLEKEGKKARQILKNPKLVNSKGVLKKRKSLLALALYKKEKKVIDTANQFLVNHGKTPYADFVMALIIETYQKLGEVEKANEWKIKLEKNFPNSPFKNEYM